MIEEFIMYVKNQSRDWRTDNTYEQSHDWKTDKALKVNFESVLENR